MQEIPAPPVRVTGTSRRKNVMKSMHVHEILGRRTTPGFLDRLRQDDRRLVLDILPSPSVFIRKNCCTSGETLGRGGSLRSSQCKVHHVPELLR